MSTYFGRSGNVELFGGISFGLALLAPIAVGTELFRAHEAIDALTQVTALRDVSLTRLGSVAKLTKLTFLLRDARDEVCTNCSGISSDKSKNGSFLLLR